MGQKLLKLYKFVADHGGLPAKIELATQTKIPSSMAAMQPDSPENLKIFKDAIKKITGETPPDDL